MRKRILIPLGLILAALLMLPLFKESPHAQSGGSVQLATVVQSFGGALGSNISINTITSNIGQTSHLLQYTFSSGNGCLFWFEGSQDGISWYVLAVGGDEPLSAPLVAQASGYFPFLRVKLNPLRQTCGSETLLGTYTGSQTALPALAGYTNTFFSASYPSSVLCPFVNACMSLEANPYIVAGFTCTNTTAASAYLGLYDTLSATHPSGTNGLIFSVPVAANATYSYSGPPILGTYALWMQGTTTWGGTTAANFNCYVSFNGTGPFFPNFPNG